MYSILYRFDYNINHQAREQKQPKRKRNKFDKKFEISYIRNKRIDNKGEKLKPRRTKDDKPEKPVISRKDYPKGGHQGSGSPAKSRDAGGGA